ncbi:PaaI family thioesterase [Thermaurantimonas aggregans]|uniref:PaaI family thioesterase n=1 Tax=Thermaurantimonas aggregans TaxID=2173829 RepID=UPI0023F373AD|nr:hotdog fold thioesterase [Thermaurantimonas aggregans]MCX8148557.1 PaaI family thioesterase [Thermaurantimonas aggregans]
MMRQDAFSQWLGISVDEVRPGYCRLTMIVRPEMTNGFGIAHGGIAYSFADSALAFAANAAGYVAKTVHLSCEYIRPANANDLLQAEAVEKERTHRFSYMEIIITRNTEKVAVLHGMAYLSDKVWSIPPTSSEAQ